MENHAEKAEAEKDVQEQNDVDVPGDPPSDGATPPLGTGTDREPVDGPEEGATDGPNGDTVTTESGPAQK